MERFSYSLTQNDSIIPVYSGGKYCYINSVSRSKITEQLFDQAYPFEGKCALIKQNGKFGIIDKQINYIIPPTFKAPADLTEKKNIITSTGDALVKWFNYYQARFDTAAFIFDEPVGPQIYFFKEGHKFYYELNDGKKTRSAAIYDAGFTFNNYMAIANLRGKLGALYSNGNIAVPFIYKQFAGTEAGNQFNTFFYAMKKGRYWHYFNGGKQLFISKQKPLSMTENVFVFKEGELCNYYNKQGIKVLPHNYKWISANGCLAINQKHEFVLLIRKTEEFTYFN
ncbi:hypothetical protein ACFGVS_15310 [Mucilaginibacter sp. AW1-7]|uniref:hypothetical protein n=1 Tax=Mucilaginibacter sp. AW1-7 TaxID=3349874 RepID=UPI003F735106